MHFILDMILMALLPLSFHLFWETPWNYHITLTWTGCLSPVRCFFMSSPLQSNALTTSSYYSERKFISVASFRKALKSDFEGFVNRRVTLTRADHPSENIPPHSPSKTGRWRQLLSVRMGKRSFKSLMILPDLSRLSTAPHPGLRCFGRTDSSGSWTAAVNRAPAVEPSHSTLCCRGTLPLEYTEVTVYGTTFC